MSDHTKIEWADATVNAVNGCTVLSPGCTNCYAMRSGGRNLPGHPSTGLTMPSKAGHVWTGEVRLSETALLQPLRWKRPRRIFWNAHGDLFHEAVPDAWIDRVFAVCALTPQHQHLILTKRSARMREYVTKLEQEPHRDTVKRMAAALPGPISSDILVNGPNVWLGVSVEDQARADERIPDLLATPAAVRFISAEPLLGPVDLESAWHGENALDSECWGECGWCPAGHPPLHNCQQGRQSDAVADKGRSGLDWIVAGGESGPGARPMHPDWARSLRDQCASANVPFFMKQWGEWAPQVGAVDGWTIPDNPEISRYDHRDWEGDHWGTPYAKGWQDEVEDDTVSRIGKKRAGRLLDGVEHNGFPA